MNGYKKFEDFRNKCLIPCRELDEEATKNEFLQFCIAYEIDNVKVFLDEFDLYDRATAKYRDTNIIQEELWQLYEKDIESARVEIEDAGLKDASTDEIVKYFVKELEEKSEAAQKEMADYTTTKEFQEEFESVENESKLLKFWDWLLGFK